MTLRKQLETATTNFMRTDGEVYGNNGATVQNWGISVLPDVRGSGVNWTHYTAGVYKSSPADWVEPNNVNCFVAENQFFNATGAVYGFRSYISRDEATTQNTETYGFYAGGTADNYFRGEVIRADAAPLGTNTTAYSIR